MLDINTIELLNSTVYECEIHHKGLPLCCLNCYTTLEISYIIQRLSKVLRRLCFRFLKWDGVRPVIFLNWFERWATLL
jgi:hypothetical protein